MYPILILPKDNLEFQFLSDLLQRMNIEVKTTADVSTPKRRKKRGIADLAGLWEGRNISADQLRIDAYRKRL